MQDMLRDILIDRNKNGWVVDHHRTTGLKTLVEHLQEQLQDGIVGVPVELFETLYRVDCRMG